MSVTTSAPKYGSDIGLVSIGDTGRWEDFEQIFNTLGIASDNDTVRDYFKEVFYLNAPADDEKYWVDDNLDSIRDPAEMQDRFDLTRTDWDSLAVANFGKKAPELRWLVDMHDTQKRDQIIANLIDYSDIDDVPDSSGEDFPAYLGLEKVPYINEVMIQFKAEIKRSGNSGSYQYTFKVDSTISIELINMYDGMTARPYKLYIEPEISCQYRYGTSTYAYSMSSLSDTAIFSIDVPADASKGYISMQNVNLPIGGLNEIKPKSNPDLNVNNVKTLRIKMAITINSMKIRLMSQDGQILYDCSDLPELEMPETVFLSVNGSNNTTNTAYITLDYQVGDPRQNHNQTNWDNFTGSPNTNESTSETSAHATIGSVNTAYTAAMSGFNGLTSDKETADDPEDISTAYIRNAPMQSPWELGFIHRAAAFQTLNLKKYNTVTDGDGFGPGACAGDYSKGDANILDQIKMTSSSTTQGKINVNSDNKAVLGALFDQIKVGSSKDDPGVGGTVINSTKAAALADAVWTANGSDQNNEDGTPFYTRAEIANHVAALSDGSVIAQENDAKQEEIIGKFINLTKTETPNIYTIIAVGQAIKDVKGSMFDKNGNQLQSPSSLGNYEQNVDEILSSQKIFAHIKRKINSGVGSDTFYIQDLKYLE